MHLLKSIVIICIVILSVMVISAILGPPTKQQYFSGRATAEQMEIVAPNCWKKAKRFLLLMGCPQISPEIHTELAILFTSCFLEAKQLNPITCQMSDCTFRRRSECLMECGATSAENVARHSGGFNAFNRIYDSIPDLCHYLLRFEHGRIIELDVDDIGEMSRDILTVRPTASTGATKPDLPGLRHIFLEQINTSPRFNLSLTDFAFSKEAVLIVTISILLLIIILGD